MLSHINPVVDDVVARLKAAQERLAAGYMPETLPPPSILPLGAPDPETHYKWLMTHWRVHREMSNSYLDMRNAYDEWLMGDPSKVEQVYNWYINNALPGNVNLDAGYY